MTAVSLRLQYVVRSTLILFRGSFWICRCLTISAVRSCNPVSAVSSAVAVNIYARLLVLSGLQFDSRPLINILSKLILLNATRELCILNIQMKIETSHPITSCCSITPFSFYTRPRGTLKAMATDYMHAVNLKGCGNTASWRSFCYLAVTFFRKGPRCNTNWRIISYLNQHFLLCYRCKKQSVTN